MILNFKPQFKGQILNGTKIHSIRYDRLSRWKPGMVIHFSTGARTKLYNQFWYGHCKSIQNFTIERRRDKYDTVSTKIWIDHRQLLIGEIIEFADSEGFPDSVVSFYEFFIPLNHLKRQCYENAQSYGLSETSLTYHGRLIHWTNKRY